jgi:hypothetical protein
VESGEREQSKEEREYKGEKERERNVINMRKERENNDTKKSKLMN